MTDLAKLKQEAEEARQNLILCIHVYIDIPERNAGHVADSLMGATAKQIALQAAEKEAKSTLVAQFNQAVINAQAIDEANPTPIAVDGTDKPLFDREQDILAAAQYDHIGTAIARKVARDEDGWIKWDGAQRTCAPISEKCSIRFRCGDEQHNLHPFNYNWITRNRPDDIIAYRIVTPAADRVSES